MRPFCLKSTKTFWEKELKQTQVFMTCIYLFQIYTPRSRSAKSVCILSGRKEGKLKGISTITLVSICWNKSRGRLQRLFDWLFIYLIKMSSMISIYKESAFALTTMGNPTIIFVANLSEDDARLFPVSETLLKKFLSEQLILQPQKIFFCSNWILSFILRCGMKSFVLVGVPERFLGLDEVFIFDVCDLAQSR